MSQRTSSRRRRGVAIAQVAVALPVLFGFAVISVDVGAMYNARTDMQRAADAAALAAAGEFAYAAADEDPTVAATEAAADLVASNPVLGRTLSVDSQSDVIFGRAYYDDVENAYKFVPGDAPTNAVRVTVRHTADSPNGPLPLYFAGIFGKSFTDVSATSVALFVQTCFEEGDCYDEPPEGSTMMCHFGDSDDSDDSQGEFGPPDSDDSDDSDSGDSGGSEDGDGDNGDSESGDSEADSDGGHTIIVDTTAVPIFLSKGDTLGACDYCPVGDSDDSDDSQGEFGPPDSSDSDDSDSGDSDGSENGDSDDSDDSQGEFGPPDSDDSDDSDAGDGLVTICHYPPGNPENPQTLRVGSPSVPAHLGHGDVLGACPVDDGDDDEACIASIRVFLIE